MLSPPLMNNDRRPRRVLVGPFLIIASAVGVLVLIFILLQHSVSSLTAVVGVIIALLAVIFGLGLVSLSRGTIHPLSLVALVSYCQLALYVARPSYAIFFQDSKNLFAGHHYGDAYLQAQCIAGAGFLAICIGWVSVRSSNSIISRTDVRPYDPSAWPAARLAAVVVVAGGFALYTIYVLQVGPARFLQGLASGRSEISRSLIDGTSAYLYSGLQFAFGALVLIHLQGSLTRQRRTILISGSLLLFALVPNLSSGSRSVFIPIAVAFLFIAFLVHPSVLRISRVMLWAPACYVLLLIAPRLWREQLSRGVSLGDSLSSSLTAESLFGDFFGGLDTAMLDAFALQVSAQAEGSIPFLWGQTYLSLPSSFVPRAIWEEKPPSVDQILNAELFPQTFAQGTGFSFGFYSEPYLNGGWIGVLLVGILFGATLGKISGWAQSQKSLFATFILIMVSSYIFPLMRGSLSFDLQRLLIPLIPLLVSLVLFRLLSPPRGPRLLEQNLKV